MNFVHLKSMKLDEMGKFCNRMGNSSILRSIPSSLLRGF